VGNVMVSAILMAGYKNKREVKRYSKTVAEHYGEKFIETGYRPLREFKTVIDGKKESKPLIQYTLEKLFASDYDAVGATPGEFLKRISKAVPYYQPEFKNSAGYHQAFQHHKSQSQVQHNSG
jgi:hypothetical protein